MYCNKKNKKVSFLIITENFTNLLWFLCLFLKDIFGKTYLLSELNLKKTDLNKPFGSCYCSGCPIMFCWFNIELFGNVI